MATYGSTSVNGLLDGNLQFLNQGYGLTGYPDYGGFDGDPVNGNAFIFLVKLGGSTGPIWLDTDLNKATGYNGYDYHVIWSGSGPPKLYSGSLGQTLIATLTDYVYVPNAQNPTAQPALEFAIPANLIGGAKSAFVTLGAGTSYITAPQAPGVAVETVGAVALDGNLGEWTQAQRIDSSAPNPAMDVYGRIDGGNMIFALHLNSGDFKSASYTTLWLDTDFNRATGFSVPISNTSGAPQVQVGAEYNLRFDTAGHVILEKGNTLWPAYSENGAAVYSETVGPVPFAFSADYKSVEVAVPLAMLGANVTGADVHVDSSYGGGPALTADGYTVGMPSIAPPAPSAPDLVAASDTGPSSTDNVTSVTTPTVTGSGAEAGATVTLYDTDGTTVLGTAIADGSGNWSITSSTLNSGDHALTVKQTDLAGDVSAASAALTVTVAPPKTSIYVLQGINPAVIGAAPFDVKAISLYGDDKQLFTAAQVHQMGGGPGGGVLLGYMSVGEAETYRDYFASIPPAALGPEDPNFPGSFQVAYWTDAWRSVTTGIIDKMIALGFDGAVFDVVDEYQRPWAQLNAPGGAVAAMVSLVKYLSDYAHAQNPNFQIWVNGAPELLGNSTYLQAIDGMFMESLFYDGTGNTRPPTDTSYSMGFLDQALAANKSVINIEYVTGAAQIADAHTKAAAAGIGSYIAHLDLNGIDMEGVPPGLTVPAPASVTTGNGSDTLVLSMSEDAYLGDAQFTVAVDGVQFGGTFTTTALHAFGTSQTFTFMGDWGVGAHTVTVNLLNDAYGGTPATDRNLYVNAISYDGTNTNQSAAIIGFVPNNFAVTDTTTPSKPIINIDGNLSDWVASERIDYSDVPGYSFFGTLQNGYFDFALSGAVSIGAGTSIWLNTDLNATTGYELWGWAAGAEYNLTINSDGSASLYTGAAGQTLVLGNIQLAYSTDHRTIEFAIPVYTLGNPGAIDTLYEINGGAQFGPTNYSAQPYLLDLAAPAAPTAPDLTAASDSGASNADNITNVTAPTFTGTAEAGSTVTLFDGATVIGTGVAAAGTWTIAAATLANGTHSITAQAADAAGNRSAASGALSVTIDTIAPAAPSAPDLLAASDSGVSSTDNITNVTRPTFTGTAEANATVTLYDGTTAVGTGVATAGQWSITTTSALAAGARSITAKATDTAGNVSAASAALSVTIDTTAPAAPTNLDLATASDTGTSSTDNITSVTTPTYSGKAEAGSTVTLFDGTTVIGTGIAVGGKWTIAASTLANGTHSITAKATDVAGNVSAASSKLSVTIDTVAPNAPAFTAISASRGNLTLTGTGDASTTVAVLNGTTQFGTTTVGTGGTWSLSFSTSSSVRTLTAVGSDAAGNKSSATSRSVLVGTSGANTLTATAGNDLFYGGSGADTFTFTSLFGHDVIADFAATGSAHDVINFHGSPVLNSFANVMAHAAQVGSGVVITQDAGNVLTLNNVTKTALTSADFKFV